jgi:ferredoxin-thioredoxin reductase catalytic subunit/rubredoxin
MTEAGIGAAAVEQLYQRLKREAEDFGYYLNPDIEFTRDLVKSLLINETRYGYWVCPCRLATADKDQDLDIICPCDYRDADLNDYGTCFCGLYVSREVIQGQARIGSIPERRPPYQLLNSVKPKPAVESPPALSIWRCRVCGYLCARENPPGVCPICKAQKDRFELFIAATKTNPKVVSPIVSS